MGLLRVKLKAFTDSCIKATIFNIIYLNQQDRVSVWYFSHGVDL